METNKIYKFANGRITIQTNSVMKTELKVRLGEDTTKIITNHNPIELEKIVNKIILLSKGE